MSIEMDIQDAADQTSVQSDIPMCATNSDAIAVLKSMVNRNVQSILSYDSAITVDYENGIVTLRGFFANSQDRQQALRAAINNPCIDRVINRASLLSV